MVMTANTAGVSAYAPNAAIPVLRRGRIFVITEDAVNVGDPVQIRISGTATLTNNGQTAILGAGTASTTPGATKFTLPNARFMNKAAAGAAVRIEFNV